MDDFTSLDKTIVRELSCRLCLCNDVVKLKPLSVELKRKLKKLFNITVSQDDFLPKAICHDCLQQVSALYLYAIKVEKNQKFLRHHEHKNNIIKSNHSPTIEKSCPLISNTPTQIEEENKELQQSLNKPNVTTTVQHGDGEETKTKQIKNSPQQGQYLEAMPLDEFAEVESVDKALLVTKSISHTSGKVRRKKTKNEAKKGYNINEPIDPIVLIDGRPAKQGVELDKQITLFYQMECFICHEQGFQFRSLMTHYKDRHGVPGYVACCGKKFHYFYPKKIIEHMAYHLQPNIFMCGSCHVSFQTSRELNEHRNNGGRSDGKIVCPRCSERYPTYHELGLHIVTHRADTLQCDYCSKILKHSHRKKTVNNMEDLILCTQCIRTLKNIEKLEKENKEKEKTKDNITNIRKLNKIRQAMGLPEEEASSH